MGAYSWNNPGESYAQSSQASFERANFEHNQQQEISQVQAQISQIENRLAQIAQEKKQVESAFSTGKANFERSNKALEDKMAALMARRGDQGNFWKWKRQTENYGLETQKYDDVQKLELMNDANSKVNEAMKNLSSASGELNQKIAMDALKQAISSRDALRKRLGMTGDNSDVQTLIDKDNTDKAKQREKEETIAGYKNQIRFLANDKQIEAKRQQIMDDERLSQTEKDQLLSLPELKTQAEKNRDAERGARANGAGKATSEASDANSMSFSDAIAKYESLTKQQQEIFDKRFFGELQSLANEYEKMDAYDKKSWKKQNEKIWKVLREKGLI